jgi:hypothetical protein
METQKNWEDIATRSLASRGLRRVPGKLAFVHKGQAVEVAIEQSVYRGYFLTVHDRNRSPTQFRERGGDFDWNAIAAQIVAIAESRLPTEAQPPNEATLQAQNRQLADELSTITGAGPTSRLSIEPSATAPGRVRVRLDEVDLDPVSVIQLYAAVSRALPAKPGKPTPRR